MSDAVEREPTAYASFNEFFTRALRDGTRPVDADPRAIVSPVDGTVSEAGALTADRLLQAKGHEYSLRALLAGNAAWERTFAGGTFATIYLAPYNYHRIHMPLAGELRESFYVPGRLFSVNRTTAQLVPGLFSRNERVFCGFDCGRHAVGPSSWSARSTSAAWPPCGTATSRRANIAKSPRCP